MQQQWLAVYKSDDNLLIVKKNSKATGWDHSGNNDSQQLQ